MASCTNNIFFMILKIIHVTYIFWFYVKIIIMTLGQLAWHSGEEHRFMPKGSATIPEADCSMYG